MNQTLFLVILLSFFLILQTSNCMQSEDKRSLIKFLAELSNSNDHLDSIWNITSDPCKDHWKGVLCDNTNNFVKKLNLTRLNLSGSFDASSLCSVSSFASSLIFLNLDGNSIGGEVSADIANCKNLVRLHLSGNRFSGNLPDSLSSLGNLKRLDISNNNFSGNLPDLSRISGLTLFLAQYNQVTGPLPEFDFYNLERFNVSYNNLSGPIPDTHGRFPASSFMGNPKLCGDPLPNKCSSLNAEYSEADKSKNFSTNQILMYSGYAVLGLVFIGFIIWRLCQRKKTEEQVETVNRVASVDDSINKPKAEASDYKTGESKSGFSMVSAESALVSSSLIVLTSPVVNGLKFEDLLRAPAELLGRGSHGTLYKIVLEDGAILVVKRIKDWAILSNDFKHMMQRLDQAKHPNVLPALAFYSSKQEKLLVYKYLQNGSLHRFLHGTKMGQTFDWSSRLSVAATIAEALAFMHQEFRDDGIAHGNLKSSNILFNRNMEPCISEYGLISVNNQDPASSNGFKSNGFSALSSAFKVDVYGFGVILLELLTGRLVQSDGTDLTTWVHSVVQEEWTGEVFDKSLISEGASEARMVNLLQVAIKCVNRSPESRPSMSQVSVIINAIRDEDERSVVSEA